MADCKNSSLLCRMDFSFLKHMNPGGKALFFVGMILIGFSLGTALVGALAIFGLGMTPEELKAMVALPDPSQIETVKWMNNIAQVCGFVLPVLLFVRWFGKSDVQGLMLHPVRNWWWLAPFWILAANGLIDFLGYVNEWLITPGSAFDQMFRPQEENAQRLTELILSGTSAQALITTVLTVAIVPALAEEFVFRGVLQPLLARATRSIHLAIWLSAFLFSFIHFQFFGFIPRLVMGAMLGYLVIWSGSLYTAIIAHCLNNVLAIFLFTADGLTASMETQALVAAGVSFLLTAVGAFYMSRKSQWPWRSFAYMGITSPTTTVLRQGEDLRES